MSFLSFCSERGLIVEHLTMGRWVRTRTKDHPKKRNGAYFFAGDFGHVRNWAEMDRTETWFRDREAKPDPNMLARMEASRRAHDAKRERDAQKAAQTARDMISKASAYTHPYLISKGLPKVRGLVLNDSLLVPMRSSRNLIVGLQEIKMDAGEWVKKMLHGTRAKGARLVLGAGTPILCEGYATGLSIQAALDLSPNGMAAVVCFSAGNIVEVAKILKGYVFADNDLSAAGQKAAEQTGLPWCMSETVGHDANDVHRLRGLMAVRAIIQRMRK